MQRVLEEKTLVLVGVEVGCGLRGEAVSAAGSGLNQSLHAYFNSPACLLLNLPAITVGTPGLALAPALPCPRPAPPRPALPSNF
jgi:hypothetical protein